MNIHFYTFQQMRDIHPEKIKMENSAGDAKFRNERSQSGRPCTGSPLQ
jgi:hypothetical protein